MQTGTRIARSENVRKVYYEMVAHVNFLQSEIADLDLNASSIDEPLLGEDDVLDSDSLLEAATDPSLARQTYHTLAARAAAASKGEGSSLSAAVDMINEEETEN